MLWDMFIYYFKYAKCDILGSIYFLNENNNYLFKYHSLKKLKNFFKKCLYIYFNKETRALSEFK